MIRSSSEGEWPVCQQILLSQVACGVRTSRYRHSATVCSSTMGGYQSPVVSYHSLDEQICDRLSHRGCEVNSDTLDKLTSEQLSQKQDSRLCANQFPFISAPKSAPARPGSQGLTFTSVVREVVQVKRSTHTHTSAQLSYVGLEYQPDNPWTGTPRRLLSWCLGLRPSCCPDKPESNLQFCVLTVARDLHICRLHLDLCQPPFPVDEKDLGRRQTH